MGKDGFLTPKAIANRIKSKGLQKLRWYCQMCQKQCRDENGFKCHINSESHQRQMLLFSENSNKILSSFSEEFKGEFLTLLRRRYGSRRVHANLVYQEYISDRDHLHMNATGWSTLSDFVKYLGKESICRVEDTEKGWFITYIDRDPETLKKQEMVARQDRLKKDEDQREREIITLQIEKARQQAEEVEAVTSTELIRPDAEPLKLGLTFKPVLKPTGLGVKAGQPRMGLTALMKDRTVQPSSTTTILEASTPIPEQSIKKSQVELLMEKEIERKQRQTDRNNRGRDHWPGDRSRRRSISPSAERVHTRNRDRP